MRAPTHVQSGSDCHGSCAGSRSGIPAQPAPGAGATSGRQWQRSPLTATLSTSVSRATITPGPICLNGSNCKMLNAGIDRSLLGHSKCINECVSSGNSSSSFWRKRPLRKAKPSSFASQAGQRPEWTAPFPVRTPAFQIHSNSEYHCPQNQLPNRASWQVQGNKRRACLNTPY